MKKELVLDTYKEIRQSTYDPETDLFDSETDARYLELCSSYLEACSVLGTFEEYEWR